MSIFFELLELFCYKQFCDFSQNKNCKTYQGPMGAPDNRKWQLIICNCNSFKIQSTERLQQKKFFTLTPAVHFMKISMERNEVMMKAWMIGKAILLVEPSKKKETIL